MNETGDVVGTADLPGSKAHLAFLWRNGTMTNLGNLPDQTCSRAYSINASDQVVGDTGICGVGGGDPFLWEHGTMLDLKSLVAPTDLKLRDAWEINDQGYIAGTANLPTGEEHAILFVPTTSGSPAPGMPTTGNANTPLWPVALALAALLSGGILRWSGRKRQHIVPAHHRRVAEWRQKLAAARRRTV